MKIPQEGEPDLPWGYFVLQAARGSTKVPDWVLLAVPGTVGRVLGVPPGEVTEEQVALALDRLPADPAPLLGFLLAVVDEGLPPPHARPRLEAAAALGSFREAVNFRDLLHDAALIVRESYGSEGFYECFEAIEGDSWDARAAVAAMLYMLLLMGNPTDQT